MSSSTHIIQFIGPPCSGKTTVAKGVYDILVNKKKVLLLERATEQQDAFLKVYDRFVVFLLLFFTFFLSIWHINRLVEIGVFRWFSWLKRFGSEYKNSIACRRFINHVSSHYDIIIADHCIGSIFFFEFADPRNVCGPELWEKLKFFLLFFPRVPLKNTYAFFAEPEVLWGRQQFKTKEVRKGLSAKEKKCFFSRAIFLLEKLKEKPNESFVGLKIEFFDSTRLSPIYFAEYIYKKLV